MGNTIVAPAPYLSPHSTGDGSRDYSSIAGNDYEPIPNPSDYASALQVYSNAVRRTIEYDNAKVIQYSKILHKNPAIIDEDVYSDPGHSEADIYNYFKKKKFQVIKRNSVRLDTVVCKMLPYCMISPYG